MKLATFLVNDEINQKIGVVTDDGNSIVALQKGAQELDFTEPYFFSDMISFLAGGTEALEKAYEVTEFSLDQNPPGVVLPAHAITLLSPVPRPESIRDCMAFEDHIINIIRNVGLKKLAGLDIMVEKIFGRKRTLAHRLNRAFYERPLYYKSNRFSVVGQNAEIITPNYTEKLDYELEFGVFLSKQGKDISKQEASGFIGGFTIFNDFSSRDIQLKEQAGRLGPSKGKDFDTGNSIGPYLVTADEVKDPYNLEMKAYVNGELWSKGNSCDMHWRFEDIISYISQSETLYPGEFIGSGTCSGKDGRGCGLEMNRFLKPGDIVELEVEKLGVLRNTIV